MAPTKKDAKSDEKEKKLSPQEQAAWILQYLKETNRPYSPTEISGNSNGKVPLTAAKKLLKDMHERGDIDGKAAGKALVYHALQPEPDENQEAKLAELADETKQLNESTLALRSEERELRARLREGSTIVPLPELRASIAALEDEKIEISARLKKLKAGDVKPVSKIEKVKVSEAWKKMKKAAEARRKIRSELWKDLLSSAEVKPKTEKEQELKEELGVEYM